MSADKDFYKRKISELEDNIKNHLKRIEELRIEKINLLGNKKHPLQRVLFNKHSQGTIAP